MNRRESLSLGAATVAASFSLLAQSNPHKVAIIGTGNRARSHWGALGKMPEARITALCDLESARADKVNETLGIKAAVYTDYRELLRDKNVEVVAIATPNYLHHEMAIAALRAGKDVLLEKPLGINYKQAIEIMRQAKTSGRTLAVGMQRRYTRADQEVLHAVENGMLGRIHLIQATEMRGDWNAASWPFTDPSTGKTANWRFQKKAAGSTELEFSIHLLAHVYSLVKSPLAKVSASGATVFYKDRDTRDMSSFLVEFQNGARLSYSFSCFAPSAGNTFSILGEKGVLRREKGGLVFAPHKGAAQTLPPIAGTEERPERQMYLDFFRSIRDRTPSPLGPEVAIEPCKIAFAADMSIAESRVVTARDFSL